MLRAENKYNNCRISFKGRDYNISNAECNPKLIQKPRIPMWIGGSGKKTLKGLIQSAKKTLDCAIYDLKDPDVIAVLGLLADVVP